MKKNNKNNKGFSLVELIIVIAIMAILIGVLAPQYLKFVERSRKSTDRQNVDEIVRAVEVYAADPEATDALATSGTVTISTTSAAVGTTTATGNIDKALAAAGIDKLVLKSSKWTDGTNTVTTIYLNFTIGADGTVSVVANSSNTGTTTNITDGTKNILE